MAVGALGLGRVKCLLRARFIVAVGAPVGELSDAFGMRIVAPEAIPLALYRMRREHIIVTAPTALISRSPHCVRFMATAAFTMLPGLVLSYDSRSLVT